MGGVSELIQSIFTYALVLAAAGTLGKATGLLKRAVVKTYGCGSISLVKLNQQALVRH